MAWAGDGENRQASFADRPHELVAGVRDERRSGVAHERDGFTGETTEDPLALSLARIVVVIGHRRLGVGMREQLRRDPLVFRENEVRAAQCLGRAWAQIAQIPDGCRDDVEAGREGLVIHAQGPLAAACTRRSGAQALMDFTVLRFALG